MTPTSGYGGLEERVARLEVMMDAVNHQLGRELAVSRDIHASIERSIDRMTELVEKQDRRLDILERNIAWAIGAFAVVIFIVNLVAPAIRIAIGLPE